MKKKLGILLFSCLLIILLTSCDEVLSVVTENESGEKVVNNYVSMFDDTVYDESASIKSWRDIDLFEGADIDEIIDDLLFKIENKKENLVVFGNEDAAVEISFFDGGYNYKIYTSIDSVDQAMNSFNF